MKAFSPRQALVVVLALFIARMAIHLVLFSDGIAVAELAGLDAAAIVVLVLSSALGPNVGAHVGSVLLYFLVVGLALVGVGYLAQVLRSPHLSAMSSFVSIMGAGVGLCLATKSWNQAAWVMGLLAVGGGCYGLTRIHQPFDALVIAAPYVVAALLFVVTGASRQRPASAFQAAHTDNR